MADKKTNDALCDTLRKAQDYVNQALVDAEIKNFFSYGHFDITKPYRLEEERGPQFTGNCSSEYENWSGWMSWIF